MWKHKRISVSDNAVPNGPEDNSTLNHQDTLETLLQRTRHALVELQALLHDLQLALEPT